MKKVGDTWLPDVDMRWGSNRRKSKASFADGGRGALIDHIEEALALVEGDGTAIDAGANVGSYTRIMAGRFSHVHAFEPAPDTAACLERNVREWGLEGRVTVHAAALSDGTAGVSMAGSARRRSVTRRVEDGGDIASVAIDALGLDDLAFLKIDVEGFEERVLRGARGTLARCRPAVMMEVKPEQNERYGDAMGSERLLLALGYRMDRTLGERGIDRLYLPDGEPAPAP